jgi:hypothetical protein
MTGDLFGAPSVIPCLSLWQPWASLIMVGLKQHETRHWPTRVRGLVAIHAAKRVDVEGAPDALCEFAWGPDWAAAVPRGAVVALAELTACLPTEGPLGGVTLADEHAGNFGPGRFAFRLENVRPLAIPIPTLGRQGFFSWSPPPDLEDRLRPANDHALMAHRFAEALAA